MAVNLTLTGTIAGSNLGATATGSGDNVLQTSPALTTPTITKGNGTEASNLVTASGGAGVITTSALTTVAAGSYVITWTNTAIATTSVIILSQMGGTNTTEPVILKATAGAGTSTLTIINDDLVNALNGTLIIGYLVL